MWRAQRSTQASAGEVAAAEAAYIRRPEAEFPEAALMENPCVNSKAFLKAQAAKTV
jgi:hypothetical protein